MELVKDSVKYPFEMRPLTSDEGGGWLISYPDLPGCIADGDLPEDAISNGLDALNAWMRAMRDAGKPIPAPGGTSSGKFLARIPRSMHARLAMRARQEGVSMNSLVMAFLAESLGRRGNRGE